MAQSNTHTHREAWLHEVTRAAFDGWFKSQGYPLPTDLRLTCGFPSRKALLTSSGRQRIGECWSPESSEDGTTEVMISPVVSDPMKVAGILAHELIHAAVGNEHGHKGPFRKLAKAMGLEGKMTATTEGEAFKQRLAPILADIGPYPHAKLNAMARNSGPKKQGTRLIKCECSNCGYTARTTRKWLDEVGPPHCPEHGPMEASE